MQAAVGLAHELAKHVELGHVVHHHERGHEDEAEDVGDAEHYDEEVDRLAGEPLRGKDGEGEEEVAENAEGGNQTHRDHFPKEGGVEVDVPAYFSIVPKHNLCRGAEVVLGEDAVVAHVARKVAKLLLLLLIFSYLGVRQYSSAA